MKTRTKSKPKPKQPAKSEAPPLRLEWIDPADLAENPANWRTHPAAQKAALKDAIAEVGWAGALLYNERTKRLIDGHARREEFAGKQLVPVLIGSWDEATEKKILATLDPLAAMADASAEKLDSLLREIDTGSAALQSLLDATAKDAGLYQDAEPSVGSGGSTDIAERFAVVIHCDNEAHQVKLLERFEKEGMKCRALIA